MKKVAAFTIVFLLILLGYQFIIINLQKEHKTNYKIKKDNVVFEIEEVYKKDDKYDGYYINVKQDDYKFVYYLKNEFNKNKKIVSDIEYKNVDDYLCLYLKTKKDVNSDILCSDKTNLVSATYLFNEKESVVEFAKSIYGNDINIDDTTEFEEFKNLKFYKNNIANNEYISIYRYKYVSMFNKSLYNIVISEKDVYKNDKGAFFGKYFILPIFNKEGRLLSFYTYNVENRKYNYIFTNGQVSSNYYIYGIIKNKMYIFDMDKKIEYELDPNEDMKIVGNVENGFVEYKNGVWQKVSITEFTQNKIKYNESNEGIDNLKHSYNKLYSTDMYYYFSEGNKIYRSIKIDPTEKVLLYENSEMKALQFLDDEFYFIKKDKLYKYDKTGLKTIAYNNEFIYNYDNIYYVHKGE